MTLKNEGRGLIFLVGSPRSGTTWLQKLLFCHPKIHTGQESDIFDLYVGPQLRTWRSQLNTVREINRRQVGLSSYHLEEEFLRILRRYLQELMTPMIASLAEGEYFLEKTPSHALYIPEILELLPDAKIIHILRDPRDVTASLLNAGRTWGAYWAPKNVDDAVSMWTKHVAAVSTASQSLGCETFREVRYERLLEDGVNEIERIVGFLGLIWSKAEIQNALESVTLQKEHGGKARQIPVYGEAARLRESGAEPNGFVRHGKVGSWRKDLSLWEKYRIWKLARYIMREKHYQ